LNELEQQGKAVFTRACAQCHGSTSRPSGSTPEVFPKNPIVRYHKIQMDVVQLRGISKTAPYFHNNSAATLEEVIDHYIALFAFVARRFPPPSLPPVLSSNGLVIDRGFIREDERAALLAYLRKL
jgi:hypothetical protein